MPYILSYEIWKNNKNNLSSRQMTDFVLLNAAPTSSWTKFRSDSLILTLPSSVPWCYYTSSLCGPNSTKTNQPQAATASTEGSKSSKLEPESCTELCIIYMLLWNSSSSPEEDIHLFVFCLSIGTTVVGVSLRLAPLQGRENLRWSTSRRFWTTASVVSTN